MDPLDLLIDTLEDLTSEELKKFQLYLTEGVGGSTRIPRGKLEKCNSTDTADAMRRAYGSHGALRITHRILKKIKRVDLANKLERELKKR